MMLNNFKLITSSNIFRPIIVDVFQSNQNSATLLCYQPPCNQLLLSLGVPNTDCDSSCHGQACWHKMNVHVPSTICLLLCKNVKKLNLMAHSSLPLPPYIVTHASVDVNSAACKACPTWISLIQSNIWSLTTERGGKKNRKCEGRESKSGAHSLNG